MATLNIEHIDDVSSTGVDVEVSLDAPTPTGVSIVGHWSDDVSGPYSGGGTIAPLGVSGIIHFAHPNLSDIAAGAAPANVQIYATATGYSNSQTVRFRLEADGGILMAGVGQGRLYSASQRARTVGQRYFDIKGNGPDEATAIAELSAKVALTHGSVVFLGRPRISRIMTDTEFTTYNAISRDSTGEQENAEIVLVQTFDSGTINERVETVTVKLQNVSDIIKNASTATNDIDGSNSKVAALVSAYYDGSGNTGYSFRGGKFVR